MPAPAPDMPTRGVTWQFPARVYRVIDADTISAEIDLGFSTYTRQHLRVADLYSPERGTEAGKAATAYARRLFTEHPDVLVRTAYARSFARYVAWVLLPSGEDYATRMISAGHGTAEPLS